MNASVRYLLGLAVIGGGICLSFLHHALFVPVLAAPLPAVLATFVPPVLAAGSAVPLVAFVSAGDGDRAYLGRAAVWYLGGAAVFGAGMYASYAANLAGPGLDPDAWFSVVNWSVGGSVIGLVVANYDVRRTRALAAARANQRTADRLAQRLSVMNRVLRHDVRNKTNVILGNAQLLEEDAVDADAVRAIEAATRSLVEIADRARTVQRVVEEESTRPLDLATCTEELLEDVRDAYPDAQVSASVADDVTVRTYPAIRTALAELLENAIEHNPGPESARAVDVRVRRLRDDGAEWGEVCIADNGPGIPERERVVLDGESETQLGHSQGTSLWLTRWVVDESGGEFTVDAPDSGGSCVRVRLPVAQ